MNDSRPIQSMVIVSGGQTGVDRAALDVALALGLSHGEWCPAGRRADDGAIPDRYQLRETTSRNYTVRTRRNVEDSDATLIINIGPLDGRPVLVVNPEPGLLDVDAVTGSIRDWLEEHCPRTLNVAGPRESRRPGAYAVAHAVLRHALGRAGGRR